MRGYLPKSVSDYTKEQCQEYLENFPTGLNAESVKNRLELLTRCQKVDLQQSEKKDKLGASSYPKQKDAGRKEFTIRTEETTETKIWEQIVAVLIIILIILGLVALGFAFWEWLKAIWALIKSFF